MQVTITRTKAGKTHHAVSVAARLGSDEGGRAVVTGRGNVTEWTEDSAKAGRFPEEVAKHVAKFYHGRLNAGDLVFRDEKGKVLAETEGTEPVAPEPKVAGDGSGEPFVSAAEAESRAMFDLRAENEELKKQLNQVNDWGESEERMKKAAEEALGESRKRVAELEAENKKLAARVKELEDAAKAKPPADKPGDKK